MVAADSGEAGATDLVAAGEVVMVLVEVVLVVMLLAGAVLAVMDSADPSQAWPDVASDSGRGGRVDLRTEGSLVAVASVIVVSAAEIAISAIVDSAALIAAFSILASVALDTHITIHMIIPITIQMIIPITIHIRKTAPAPI
jgi:hypothetical protein